MENSAAYPSFTSISSRDVDQPRCLILTRPRFVVLASDRDLARKVFSSPAYVKPIVVPIAESLMGKNSWVFLDGKAHVDFRKGLIGLFTRVALESYLPTQERVLLEYFERFVEASRDNGGKPMPFMGHFREINCAVSCRTFVGQYISNTAIKKIADDYYCITAALELVNIPLSIYVPYTKVWLGKRAADGVLAEFSKCAAASRIAMAAGEQPACIIDRWITSMNESRRYQDAVAAGNLNAEKPSILLREFTDFESRPPISVFAPLEAFAI